MTYYLIDRCRGSPLLRKFFKREFQGILVTDIWGAYNAIRCMAKQKCIPHLLRDLLRVEKYQAPGRACKRFGKKLGRLLRGAMRLSKHSASIRTPCGVMNRRPLWLRTWSPVLTVIVYRKENTKGGQRREYILSLTASFIDSLRTTDD